MAYPYPNIDGTDLALANIAGPMTVREDDRSTYLSGRNRTRRKGALRLWLAWEWTFRGTAGDWAVTRNLLEGDADGEFSFSPRGINTLLCRCTSELPNLTPLYRRTAANELVYTVDVRVEAVAPVTERPPVYVAPTGDLVVLADAAGDTLADTNGNVLVAFS